MAYVPGCRHDLFISYAAENNHDGWIEQFVTLLSKELNQRLGRHFDLKPKSSVFWDLRAIEVAQSVPDEVTKAARGSALLIPILSPGYLDSRWCDRERADFFSNLPHGAGPADCLAPVVLWPVDEATLDPHFVHAHRFSFVSSDGQTPVPAGSPAWKENVARFASQVRNALQNLRRKCRPVFLGKTAAADRLEKLRDWCRGELEDRCCRTTPDHLHILNNPDAVRACIQESGLAVHFLGGADSTALETIETSVSLCSGPTILFQPYGVDLSPDESLFLADFERDMKVSPGHYQRLTGKNDQELLSLIDEHITQSRAAGAVAPSQVDLALVCDEADLALVRQMKEDLSRGSALAVAFPDFLGGTLTRMERLRLLQEFLSRGYAHLFYYGAAERSRLELIWKKAETTRPAARRAWFLAPPDLAGKQQKHPEALATLEQIIDFVQSSRSARA